MVKSEIRSTKSETNPKGAKKKEANAWARAGDRAVSFSNFSVFSSFRACFGFRISDFEFGAAGVRLP
jgi:hypothetical protein